MFFFKLGLIFRWSISLSILLAGWLVTPIAIAQNTGAGTYQNHPATLAANSGYTGGVGNMPKGYTGAGHGATGEGYTRTDQCGTYCSTLAGGTGLSYCTQMCESYCGDNPSVGAWDGNSFRTSPLVPEHRRDLAVCVAIYTGAFGLQKTGEAAVDYRSSFWSQAVADFGGGANWRAIALGYDPQLVMTWDPCNIRPGGVANLPSSPGQTVQRPPYHIHKSATCNKRFKSWYEFNSDLAQYDLGPICAQPNTINNCEDWCKCGGCEVDAHCVRACKENIKKHSGCAEGNQNFPLCGYVALSEAKLDHCQATEN